MARSQIHIPRVNPKPVEGAPIEVTLREERLGSLTCEIAPGVHMVSQISKTGEHTWVTHGEQRIFFFLRDDQDRGCYFYQSFSGTGGKQQGSWFPSGGLLGSVWVIKGNPKTDPGAGRVSLLEFYEKVNQVLPHSDEDTDALLKKLTGFDYGDFSYKDKFEVKPTFILKEKGAPTELQKKWSGWAYRFWAEHGLTKQWGPRTFNLPDARTNPVRFHVPPDVTAKHVPINVKPVFSLGGRSRLMRAGEVTTPKTDVLFILPDANGDFDQAQIQPQRGVLKILIDTRNTGPDKLTPLGLWHRFFQSHAEIASAVPAKERHSRLPGISGPVSLPVQDEVGRIIGSRWGVNVSPRTRWWRKSNKEYLGSEALFDSMAMAMAFPGGIVYGVRPVQGSSHPPDVLMQLRSFLAPIEKKDTEVVRQWVAKQSRRGAVYFTSGDLIDDSKYDHRTINQLDAIFPASADTTHVKQNPGIEPGVPDLEGRHIPARYLEGLPRHLQEQRIRELTKSRDEYGKNFKELPTDRAARKMGLVKLSAYREVAQARGFDISQTPDLTEMAAAALRHYRKGRKVTEAEVERLADGLQQVYRKGMGAWKSGGHRPGASARNWADARVASLLVGGKAAWTADRKQFALLPDDVQAAVVQALPAVYTALRRQGRQRDIAAIQSAVGGR